MSQITTIQGVTIVELGPSYDSLDDGALERLDETLMSEIKKASSPRLVLDLSHTSFIGSSFIELMVRVWRRIRERGGAFAFCCAQPFCVEVLHITRLDTLWTVYSTRQDAVAELSEQ